jgi:hypothetical protein
MIETRGAVGRVPPCLSWGTQSGVLPDCASVIRIWFQPESFPSRSDDRGKARGSETDAVLLMARRGGIRFPNQVGMATRLRSRQSL